MGGFRDGVWMAIFDIGEVSLDGTPNLKKYT
jgi:hypothetical protein